MITDGELTAVRHVGRAWIERDEIKDYFARQRAEVAKRRVQLAKARQASRRGRTSP